MNLKLRSALKKIPFLTSAVRMIKNKRYDRTSISLMKSEREIKRSGAVRVGFICQYLPAWSKMERIYQMMKADADFQPYLICLPSGIKNNALENPEAETNDTYEYIVSHGYPDAVNAMKSDGGWVDLEELEIEYLFYQRPYNNFLPPEYTAPNAARFSKVCLIMYGMEMLEEITNISLNRDFMAYVSYYFAENTSVADINIKKNPKGHKLGYQKTLCIGMPVLESLLQKQNEVSPAWEFSKNGFRAIWTPRWTTDLAVGGSNFFTYYKTLTEYAKNHPDMDFLYRPHPLTFSHFLETGEMTEKDIEEFHASCDAVPNISIDKQQQYDATFWGSSVLISDYSGMVPEYFVTGKPLIFCMSNMVLTLSDFGRRLIDGCYVVNNSEELFSVLDNLRAGIDPMKEKRHEILEELYGNNAGVSERILNLLRR